MYDFFARFTVTIGKIKISESISKTTVFDSVLLCFFKRKKKGNEVYYEWQKKTEKINSLKIYLILITDICTINMLRESGVKEN